MLGCALRRCLIVSGIVLLLSGHPRAEEASSGDEANRRGQHERSTSSTPHDHSSPRAALFPDDKIRFADKSDRMGDEQHDLWNYYYGYYVRDLKITDVLLAVFTLALVLYTRGLHRSTKRLWETGEKQVAAAIQSADVALRTMIASNRAWIKITAQLTSGLIYDDGGVRISVRIICENTGHSPALCAFGMPELVARTNDRQPSVLLQSKRYSAPIFSNSVLGMNVMPQDTCFTDYDVSL